MKENKYKSDDLGVFISLATIPFGIEKDFYHQQIEKGLFERYRIELSENNIELNDDDSVLYKPNAYCLFGSYDLAIISLIDDFTFGCRNFHPYSHLQKKISDVKNFNYQVITGLTSNSLYSDGIEAQAKKTFLSNSNNKYPYIGICNLKIKNSLLIGSGLETIWLIENTIKQIVNNKEGEIDFMIVESFSWHELSLLLFSNSTTLIAETVKDIREITYGNIKQLFPGNDHVNNIILNSWGHKVESVKTKKLPVSVIETICDRHVFVGSTTFLGVDIRSLNGDNSFMPVVDKGKDTGTLYTRLFLKPGQLKNYVNFHQQLNLEKPLEEVDIIMGNGDFVLNTILTVNDFKEYHHSLKKDLESTNSSAAHYLRKIKTIPQFPFKVEDILKGQNGSTAASAASSATEYLREHIFDTNDIAIVRDLLYQLRVSKNTRERAIKMFVNYNDGMQDTVLYSHFIELKSYLKNFIHELGLMVNSRNADLNDLHETIDRKVSVFESAYKNRFHQSNRMNDVTDFNIEHNGGIQQIVSALDGVVKSLRQNFYRNRKSDNPVILPHPSVVFTTGESGIYSDYMSVRLNYFHVFQPELFCATIVKETINKSFKGWNFFEVVNKKIDNKDELALFYKYVSNNNFCALPECKDYLVDKLNKAITKKPEKYYTLKYYLTFLTQDMVDYLVADVICFCYGYNYDIELYNFWLWNVLYQDAKVYNTDGSPNEKVFIRNLLRFYLLHRFMGLNPDEKFAPQGKQYQQLLLLHRQNVSLFSSLILQQDSSDDTFFKNLKNVLDVFISDYYFMHDLAPDGRRTEIDKYNAQMGEYLLKAGGAMQLHEQYEEDCRGKFNLSNSDSNNRIKLVSAYQWIICQKLENGENELIKWQKKLNGLLAADNLLRPNLYLTALFTAYLKQMQKMFTSGAPFIERDNKGYPVFMRDSNGNIIDERKMCFDPMGGLFTINKDTRREYFKLRSSIIKSLCDFSLKMKNRQMVK